MVGDGGVFIALGSNLGDRAAHVCNALRELEERGDVHVVTSSGLYETEPVGGPPDQPRYLNAVAEIATELPPHELLEWLQEIERRHDRERNVRNGPRTLDLDLLLYRDQIVDEPDLCVPHPRMWSRDFVMKPLAEICDLGRLVAARRLRDRSHTPSIHHVPRYSGRPEALA